MDYREAYEKALQLLNVRFLSEGELKAKLRRRGVDDDVLEDVVAALEGEHFLDDQRLARDVYRYYARKWQYGHLFIVNRLRRRCPAPCPCCPGCLRRRCLPVPEDVERPDEYALAGDLVKRKFSYRADEARKAARFLQYRGFSPSVIREVLEDFTVH